MRKKRHIAAVEFTKVMLSLCGTVGIGLLIGGAGCNLFVDIPGFPTPAPTPAPQPTPSPGPEPEAPKFGGDAAIVTGEVGGVGINLVATDELSSDGGALETSLLEVEAPGVLTAQVAHVSVIGQGLFAESEASIANLQITIGENTITASFLSSMARAECVDGAPEVDGDFDIAELVVNGESLSLTAEANQTFTIRNAMDAEVGQIVVNEQSSSIDANRGEIEVNALRVQVFGQADISVLHTRAVIECPIMEPELIQVGDFITGGGFIETDTSFANFGVAGGIMDDQFWGHLVYIDHGTDLKVKGTSVTAYEFVNETTRRIEGACEINQVGGNTFEVEVADNGEPGINDTFSISLSNGYSASGTVIGGNIQLHEEVEDDE